MADIKQAAIWMHQKLCAVERGNKREGSYIKMRLTLEDRFETIPRNLTRRDLLAEDWETAK
jgi:hypothetical protein